MASTTASNLAGASFRELVSALQGTLQAVAATGEDAQLAWQLQQQKPARRDNNHKVVQGATVAAGRDKQDGNVASCGGAMPDTTFNCSVPRAAPRCSSPHRRPLDAASAGCSTLKLASPRAARCCELASTPTAPLRVRQRFASSRTTMHFCVPI
jgi:hypothetical protein